MKPIESTVINELSQSMEIDLHEKKSIGELVMVLADHINYLIGNDFNKLMRVLYRVDVSEKTLRASLQNKETDAGGIIAELIVARQLEKIRTRQQFRSDDNIPENEKW